MAKKKSQPDDPDTDVTEMPAEVPAENPPDTPAEQGAWSPPPNCIVEDKGDYKIRVGGQWYRHVGEAPDGRWVYELDQ